MNITERKLPFFKYTFLTAVCLMLGPQVLIAAQTNEDQAPGRTMAQQATKDQKSAIHLVHFAS